MLVHSKPQRAISRLCGAPRYQTPCRTRLQLDDAVPAIGRTEILRCREQKQMDAQNRRANPAPQPHASVRIMTRSHRKQKWLGVLWWEGEGGGSEATIEAESQRIHGTILRAPRLALRPRFSCAAVSPATRPACAPGARASNRRSVGSGHRSSSVGTRLRYGFAPLQRNRHG